MFKESTVDSSGPYKITSLSANLDLSTVTNQQDYGFSTDVDMAFAYVDVQTINFTWDVLDPVTNKSANINDGIFNYFSISLLVNSKASPFCSASVLRIILTQHNSILLHLDL